jgi:hypothetical protein
MHGFRGGHEYHRIQVGLDRIHSQTKDYIDQHGRLPEPEDFNSILKDRWIQGRQDLQLDEESDFEDWHLAFIADSALGFIPSIWDLPPRYVVSSELPDGFGFYIDGADGFSRTQGHDRDDINSWDRTSIDYYYQRRHYLRLITWHTVSLTLAFGIFFAFNVIEKFIKPNKSRHATTTRRSV